MTASHLFMPFAWLLLSLLPVATSQVDIGTVLSSNQVPPQNTTVCAATPSQTFPCASLKIDHVAFKVGYDPETLQIKYLSTQDKNFQTEDGLRVGGWMKVREDQLLAIHGWMILGPKTKDGWRPVVGLNLRDTDDKVRFADGTIVDLSQPKHQPLRTGKVKILEFEKGGV